MKILSVEHFYGLVQKINLLLTLSALGLLIYLVSGLGKPYSPSNLDRNALKMQSSELMQKEAAILEGTFAFKEDVFRKKQLFSSSEGAGFAQGKRTPVLLGISLGAKKLAMIKDPLTNKNYYCMEGDKIGDYTVKQILKDQVILESGGNLLEISQ